MVSLAKAYKEIYEILKYVPSEEKEKISEKLLRTIEKNMDVQYEFEIKDVSNFEKQEILPETRALLAVIYRDYWATPDEKAEIVAKEKAELEEYNRQQSAKNDLEFVVNRAKVNKEKIDDAKEATGLTVVEEKSWFSKFLKKMKLFFSK